MSNLYDYKTVWNALSEKQFTFLTQYLKHTILLDASKRVQCKEDEEFVPTTIFAVHEFKQRIINNIPFDKSVDYKNKGQEDIYASAYVEINDQQVVTNLLEVYKRILVGTAQIQEIVRFPEDILQRENFINLELQGTKVAIDWLHLQQQIDWNKSNDAFNILLKTQAEVMICCFALNAKHNHFTIDLSDILHRMPNWFKEWYRQDDKTTKRVRFSETGQYYSI